MLSTALSNIIESPEYLEVEFFLCMISDSPDLVLGHLRHIKYIHIARWSRKSRYKSVFASWRSEPKPHLFNYTSLESLLKRSSICFGY
jgi:hypothetical protein